MVLFWTALCTLLLEILLTRVLSVVMWYHFTFAVISISLLGIAGGAMLFYRRHPKSEPSKVVVEDFWELTSVGLNVFSLAVALPVLLMLMLIATPTISVFGATLLVLYFGSCSLPFFASGYLTAAIFRLGASQVSSLYAYDLIGAALGCLIALPALHVLGGIGSLLFVSLLTAFISVILAWQGSSQWRKGVAAFTVLVFLGVLSIQLTSGKMDLQTVKLSMREVQRDVLEVKWNSHSRLALLDYFTPGSNSIFPFLSWGLSSVYEGWLPRQYLITIDGASETPITQIEEDIQNHEYLAWDLTSLPYQIKGEKKTLIIGAGGGRDVLTALYFGAKDITGVELNQGIVDWVRGDYAEFAGHIYDRPGVKMVVNDGRNFIQSSSDHYDLIQISMIDTFAATSAGAFTLSENNLYTAEAFDSYLAHLHDDGLLSINRFFLKPPQQTLRIVTLAREALVRWGATDPAAHIIVVMQPSKLGDNGIVMIRKTPFTSNELLKVREISQSRGFNLISFPGETLENTFSHYLNMSNPEEFYSQYPFEVRPPTDNWPFFFNTAKTSMLLETLSQRGKMSALRVYNFDAVFILFVLLVLAVLSLGAFVFLPLIWPRVDIRQPRMPALKLPYFVFIALGFILVEMVLIQRFTLYLGHPVYSLTIILMSVLLFSGLGSAWTARFNQKSLSTHLAIACVTIVTLIAIHQWFWSTFLDLTLGLPLSIRILLTMVTLLPMGLAMGMAYPLGLRKVSVQHPEGLPWVWAVNAGASVLGSIAAFAIAMVVGFKAVLVLSACCYLGALGSSLLLNPSVHPVKMPIHSRSQNTAEVP